MGVIMDCRILETLSLHASDDLLNFRSCENTVLWRGHFIATGNEKSVNLSINGGTGNFKLFFTYIDGDLDEHFF
jgi:hypothetical protein